ncbi:unnamed protein product [Owenia fusiformis]|uniref:Uncharacterized protein n=1 Tax=Owenia fusiformis TaxID=6347 RepID=A0A8J1T6W8_OWEFU|nr:unnamed protein product [Owenia fusiformis]
MIAFILAFVAAASAAPSAPVPAFYSPGPFIVNGEVATPHEFPHQLSLQAEGLFGWGHICGAVLTDATWVTTAAHCVNADGYRVIAGGQVRNSVDGTGNEQVVNVAQVIQHEDFDQDGSVGFPNDIALLRLESPITLTAQRATIPVASGSTDFANQNCIISGWGDTTPGDGVPATELRKATLPILSGDDCQDYWLQSDPNMHICIYDQSDNQGSCQGDSGGPMTCREGGNNVVAGVTSWGVVGCLGQPSVYVRTSNYRQWLCSNSGNTVAC